MNKTGTESNSTFSLEKPKVYYATDITMIIKKKKNLSWEIFILGFLIFVEILSNKKCKEISMGKKGKTRSHRH